MPSEKAVPMMAALETALRWVSSPEPVPPSTAASVDTDNPPLRPPPQEARPAPAVERPALSPAPSSPRASEPSRAAPSRAEPSRAAPSHSVHIGTLEVRIEPPPSLPQRPAPAPRTAPGPRAPLARGFTSSFGLKQE
ncbi:hypothetical protein F0U61_20430 [Archangium violaceum]|uniref:hypothetical protein n=1 Tax=Archangium violaceum TaxID=83451 RepID=UPI002B30AF3F|nr:hypothetical protein F0U61_20430 [Archangium violaceum]